MKASLFSEPFFVGCNYWASHAGTNMWHIWDEEVIASDFARIAAQKLTVLRIFPLWPDFQPIKLLYGASGEPREVRLGEDPLPDTEAGRAGMDETMLERFGRFCDLAEAQGLRLIVGLLTGWMSGRLYVPPALEGKNVLTDPMALNWELKFVKLMVSRFKNHPAIAAWDLGNECNCMGKIARPEEAELWTTAIADAIRVADPEGTSSGLRPVVSGMHGLTPDGMWRPDAHGEAVDILTTHPYPAFTPYCDTDPLGGFKSSLHAVAESLWYRGLGKRPCFAEEVGTLGSMLCDEQVAADYIHTVLYQLWAHNCHGLLWWCAAEQSHLTHAPYDWDAVERELGLFRLDGTPKPVAQTLAAFSKNVWHIGALGPRITDAVCVTTAGYDAWGAAYGAFLLAKQAGLDIEYADGSRPLPEAPAYIVPSLAGGAAMTRRAWYALFDRVLAGATLFMTLDTALLSPFAEICGVRVHTRSRTDGAISISFPDQRDRLTVTAPFRLILEPVSAKVLATEGAHPVMVENGYGKGRVVLLAAPVERYAAMAPNVLETTAVAKLYRMADLRSPSRMALSSDNLITMTEHPQDENTRVLTFVNATAASRKTTVKLSGLWRLGEPLGSAGDAVPRAVADGFSLTLAPDRAAVLTIRK